MQLTSVEMGLLCEFVVRVAVGVDGLVELLKRHEGVDQLIVGVKQRAQPLLVVDVMNLCSQVSLYLFQLSVEWHGSEKNLQSATLSCEESCTTRTSPRPGYCRKCAPFRG